MFRIHRALVTEGMESNIGRIGNKLDIFFFCYLIAKTKINFVSVQNRMWKQ